MYIMMTTDKSKWCLTIINKEKTNITLEHKRQKVQSTKANKTLKHKNQGNKTIKRQNIKKKIRGKIRSKKR